MLRFVIGLLDKLTTLLNTLMLIKYIITKNIENYPQEIISAIDTSVSQIEKINDEIRSFMQCRK